MIIFATVTATLLWAELNNPYIWLLVLVTLGFGLIGFFDDYLKVIKKHNQGLSGRAKLVTQTLVALVPAIWFYVNPGFDTTLTIPFFKQVQPDLGSSSSCLRSLSSWGAPTPSTSPTAWTAWPSAR